MGDQHGADSVNSVLRMKERGGVFLSLGGNFLSAMSDTEHHRTIPGKVQPNSPDIDKVEQKSFDNR